jgi:hypothetical protein
MLALFVTRRCVYPLLMNPARFFMLVVLNCFAAASFVRGEEKSGDAPEVVLDGSDIKHHLRERLAKILRLSRDEQLKLEAATAEAMNDPDVKAALAKRERAMQEFTAALYRGMVRSDPTVAPLLEAMKPRDD